MKKTLPIFALMFIIGCSSSHGDTPDRSKNTIEKPIAKPILGLLDPNPLQPPIENIKPPLAATEYRFPTWLFDDPKGGNALITTTQLENQDKPIWTYTNYFQRFSPGLCKYAGNVTVIQVARTQKDFDTIMKTMIGLPAVLPHKLDFEKELFIFVFNGTQDANAYTLVEVSEIDRNNGPIKLGNKSFKRDGKLVTQVDHVMVRVEVQIGKPSHGVEKGLSPWTMIRVNKETFFKEYSMSDETRFVIIESRNYIYTQKERPVDGKQ
jgi:hypothetical protein